MAWKNRHAWLLLALSWTLDAAAQGVDSDGDGVWDEYETGDTDGDGVPDSLDPDDDGDGLLTRLESADPNGDGNPADALDTDHDGGPNFRDADDDGDMILTFRERENDPFADVDGDGIWDYLDADADGSKAPPVPPASADTDGDGLDNAREDRNGNGWFGDDDSDGDHVPDYRDRDDDGDLVDTRFECGDPAQPVDSDGDGQPNYLDPDDEGDSVPTAQEQPDPNGDGDPVDAVSTAHAIADYLNPDDDGDSIPTLMERPGGVSRDSDGDGVPDYLDEDDDDDTLLYEGLTDTDHDGTPNYLDVDDDDDRVLSVRELVPEFDTDHDGSSDPYDPDDDGDGLDTTDELGPNVDAPQDSDADGRKDYLDPDDDDDTVPTLQERSSPISDHDGDGHPDYLDPEDDGDGIPTKSERGISDDVDGDGLPNWLDLDSDGDGVPDAVEGTGDDNGDGIPNFLDPNTPTPMHTGADAGSDAGSVSDSGAAAGVRADAGSGLGVSPPSDSDGGGCAASGGHSATPPLGSLALLWLALSTRRRRSWSALLALLFAAGCGDDGDDTASPIDSGFHPIDAGLDARASDAADLDAASADGAPNDAGGLGSECTVEGDLLSLPIEQPGERAWTALVAGDRAHVAYVVASCTGLGAATGTQIVYMNFASTGPFGSAQTLTPDPEGQCHLRRSPALAVGTGGGLDAYFTANTSGSYELYRQDVALSMQPQRLTDDPEGAFDSELGTVAAPFGGSALLAYVNQTAIGAPGQLVTRRPGLAENEIVAASTGEAPARLTLLDWPNGSIAGVLGWVSDIAGAESVRYQRLTIAGAPAGAPVELSTAVGQLSELAFAANSQRAAVVYTIQNDSIAELRFRALAQDGQPAAGEVKLTSANRSVEGPSIALYSQGYVVAFREIPAAPEAAASLRLMFVDADGQVGGERRLATAARGGSGSAVFVMNDGRLIVLWSDFDAGGASLQGVRALCL